MRTISVVTPVHPPHMRFLREAYESLRAQELPPGWRWEWLVQHDGEASSELFSFDARVSFSSSPPSGPAGARNVALARSSGEFVRNLDADDLLLDGALTRDVEVLLAHPGVGWVTSAASDLLSTGEVVPWESHDPAEGVLEPGRLLDAFIADEWRLPVVPGTLCARRDLLLALGGWMALPSSEDTGLLMALQTVSPGYFVATPGMLYRKHGAQQTSGRVHNDPVDKELRYGMIVDRAQALRNLLAQPTTPR
ncbi:glycosyltransferase [Lentzea sp. NPDC060358]|uniref:glycosyltransferase n=1 Tax=Lentzea sp. NPDC060358 TaxID=3347103 RepID=UPI0036647206